VLDPVGQAERAEFALGFGQVVAVLPDTADLLLEVAGALHPARGQPGLLVPGEVAVELLLVPGAEEHLAAADVEWDAASDGELVAPRLGAVHPGDGDGVLA